MLCLVIVEIFISVRMAYQSASTRNTLRKSITIYHPRICEELFFLSLLDMWGSAILLQFVREEGSL